MFGTILGAAGVLGKVMGAGSSGSDGIFARIKAGIQQRRLAKGKPLLLPPSPALAAAQGGYTNEATYSKSTAQTVPQEESFMQKYKIPLIVGGSAIGLGGIILLVRNMNGGNSRKRRR